MEKRWFDEEDRVYIIFTVEDIADLMSCGTQKAVKLLKELNQDMGISLIEKKRLGLGKPNVIYVKNFMLYRSEDEGQVEKQGKNPVNIQNCERSARKVLLLFRVEIAELSTVYF